MPDKFDIIDPKRVELQGYIEKVPWKKFLDYGSVKIMIQNGKPVLITLEETVKMLDRA
jgi:hypothetical protein